MMNADGSFLDRLCDRAAQPVNLQQLRCGRAIMRGALRCGLQWRGITLLGTGILICVHRRSFHLRASAIRTLGFFIADKGG
jgi:hypothetical protein